LAAWGAGRPWGVPVPWCPAAGRSPGLGSRLRCQGHPWVGTPAPRCGAPAGTRERVYSGGGGSSGRHSPGGSRSRELCWAGCRGGPCGAAASAHGGGVGEPLHPASMALPPRRCLGRAGVPPCGSPTAGRAGQRARGARTRPLSGATALGTRGTLGSSEFPFSVFVSFLLTFFPSGIKGWMGTMVTGWCGQPGPAARVTPGRGQRLPGSQPCRALRKGEAQRTSACAPVLLRSGAAEPEPAWPLPTRFPSRSPGAACHGRFPGARARPRARPAGRRCGTYRPAASHQAAGDLGGVGAHPRRWLNSSLSACYGPAAGTWICLRSAPGAQSCCAGAPSEAADGRGLRGLCRLSPSPARLRRGRRDARSGPSSGAASRHPRSDTVPLLSPSQMRRVRPKPPRVRAAGPAAA